MQTPDAQITEFLFKLGDREKSVLRSAAERSSAKADFTTLCKLYLPDIRPNQIALLQKYFSSSPS
jgi:hypothetical protein